MPELSEEEKAKRKAELRARLEAQAQSAPKKKGFMTPERKKRLKAVLRKQAAEELKKEQERKAEERRQMIIQRTGNPKKTDGLNEAELQAVCKEYWERYNSLMSEKYDLEWDMLRKEFEIGELSTKVNERRGKFVKPPLKKVPQYAQKIEKMLLMARKEVGFTVQLKSAPKKRDEPIEEKEKAKPEFAK